MKKLFIIISTLFVLGGCQEKDISNPPDTKLTAEMYQEWWQKVSTIDEDIYQYLVKRPQFIDLCKELDQEKLIEQLNSGIPVDTVFKNYPKTLHELIDFGLKNGIPNILFYKNHYLTHTRLQSKMGEIIVEGKCELRDTWISTHHTCILAYEEGLSRYKTMMGCCERRFKLSIENAMVHLPDAGYDICTLFSYVINPSLLDFECPYYANIFNMLQIPSNKRKSKLLELEYKIEGIIMQISMDQRYWVSCSCQQHKPTLPGTGGSEGGSGEGSGGGLGYEPGKFPPIPDYIDKEYPPQILEPTYENKVILNMTENLMNTLFGELNLEWFLNEYANSDYEYAMSFKRDAKSSKYKRTEPRTDQKNNNVLFETDYLDDNTTVAVIHTHPNGDPHSVHDLFTLADMNQKSKGLLKTSIIGTANDLYILYVSDPIKAEIFHTNYLDKQGQLTSQYGRNASLISKQLGSQAMDMNDILMFSKAAILDYYDAGMVMLKWNKMGNLSQHDARYNDYIIEMSTIKR